VRSPKGEIHALAPQREVVTVLQRQYAVVKEPCGSAPDHDVSMLERYSTLLVLPGVAAE
jgi:hypothetical protein